MPEKIQWHTDLDKALVAARGLKKPILLDFFNPEWIGCQQMDAVTYPTEEVIEAMDTHVVADRIQRYGWLAPEQTLITSTCGMNHLPRPVAFGKLKSMVEAKRLLSA